MENAVLWIVLGVMVLGLILGPQLIKNSHEIGMAKAGMEQVSEVYTNAANKSVHVRVLWKNTKERE